MRSFPKAATSAFYKIIFPSILSLMALSSFGQFDRLQAFIPPNFSILDSAAGDINKDGLQDLVVILRNRYEDINTDTTRPLLLLLGNGRGQYKLFERNDSVVLCMGCGGIYGDPYDGLTVKTGYFSVEHMGGSGWRWTRIITFKYNATRKQFFLHRDAGFSWNVSDTGKMTEILNRKEDFDGLPFDKFSYNRIWQEK
jgi:hypothetical protein